MRLGFYRGFHAGRTAAVILSGLLVVSLPAAEKPDPRQQLALAEKDDDTFARIELIRRILEQEPQDAALREQLADLWLATGDYDMAEQTVREWPDAPAFVRASVTAAVLYHRDEKPDEAIKVLTDFRTTAPQDLEITRQLTDYLYTLQRDREVVELLSAAPGVEADADLLATRALARRKLRDFDAALVDFAAAEKLDPNLAAVTGNKVAMERLQAALVGIRAADTALQKDPADFAALIQRAYWYQSTGFAAESAWADAEKARQLRPESAAARVLQVNAGYSAGKLSASDARNQELIDINKALPDLKMLARLQTADEAVRKANKAAARRDRAILLADGLQQYAFALSELDAALVLDPKDSSARVARMVCLVQLDRAAEAAAEFQTLSAGKPSAAQLASGLSALAEASLKASDYDTALEQASLALKTRASAPLYRQRAVIFQRLYRTEEAEADLTKAAGLEKGNRP